FIMNNGINRNATWMAYHYSAKGTNDDDDADAARENSNVELSQFEAKVTRDGKFQFPSELVEEQELNSSLLRGLLQSNENELVVQELVRRMNEKHQTLSDSFSKWFVEWISWRTMNDYHWVLFLIPFAPVSISEWKQ